MLGKHNLGVVWKAECCCPWRWISWHQRRGFRKEPSQWVDLPTEACITLCRREADIKGRERYGVYRFCRRVPFLLACTWSNQNPYKSGNIHYCLHVMTFRDSIEWEQRQILCPYRLLLSILRIPIAPTTKKSMNSFPRHGRQRVHEI
jgi:hypothetical protein